jgi:hypothetical protein
MARFFSFNLYHHNRAKVFPDCIDQGIGVVVALDTFHLVAALLVAALLVVALLVAALLVAAILVAAILVAATLVAATLVAATLVAATLVAPMETTMETTIAVYSHLDMNMANSDTLCHYQHKSDNLPLLSSDNLSVCTCTSFLFYFSNLPFLLIYATIRKYSWANAHIQKIYKLNWTAHSFSKIKKSSHN